MILARGIFAACLLSAAGAALFGVAFTPARRVLAVSVLLGLAAGAALLLLQAESMAGSVGWAGTVLTETLFGHVLAAQLATLALAGVMSRYGGGWPALLLSALALGLHCLHLHGWAIEGRFGPLVIAELLHLLAAGAWLGGLLPLALALNRAAPAAGCVMARRFSVLGAVCVAVIAATAFYQGRVLIGSAGALTGTFYGHVALVKLALLAVLLALAARHRFRLAPRLLTGADPRATQRALVRSVAVEAAVGLLVVLVAALLASLPPAGG